MADECGPRGPINLSLINFDSVEPYVRKFHRIHATARYAVTACVRKMNYSRRRCVILSFIRRRERGKNKARLDVIERAITTTTCRQLVKPFINILFPICAARHFCRHALEKHAQRI